MATADRIVVTAPPSHPRVGLWCPICLAPTGYETNAYVLDETGVRPVGTVRACSESDDPGHFLQTSRQGSTMP